MNWENPNRLEMSGSPLGELVNATLDDFAARVSSAWQLEHDGDGRHGDATFRLGDATAWDVGAGVWMAPSSARGLTVSSGAYDLRVGDPAGNYFAWDGAARTLVVNGSGTFTGTVDIGNVTIDTTGILVDPSHNGFTSLGSYRFGTNWGMFGDFSDAGPTYTTEIRTYQTVGAVTAESALRANSGGFEARVRAIAEDGGSHSIVILDSTEASITGTLNVDGAVDLDSTLNVDGAATLQTTLHCIGAVDCDSTLNVDGAFTLTGTATLASGGGISTIGGRFHRGTIGDGNQYWALDFTGATVGFFQSGGTGTGTNVHLYVNNANGVVGSISTNASTTSYNTSSDATLKRDLGLVTVPKLASIKVRAFEWLSDGKPDVGVFAQEVADTHPEAVTPPSADPDRPTPWMVDYSKFVPDLIVGWQHLAARVAALEAR
jgi:hypothetical protein